MKWSAQLTHEPAVQRSLGGERVSEGEDKTGSKARDSRETEGSDPFEDRTQPLASADDGDYDTTTWAGSAGAPMLSDEFTAPVPLPVRPDASGAASDLAPDPSADGEEESTVLAEPSVEAEIEVEEGEAGFAPDAMDESPTIFLPPDTESLSSSTPEPEMMDAAATVVAAVEAPYEPELGPITDTGGTIPPSSALHPMLLERIEPSLGRGERLRLDAAHWRVQLGRADENNVRLYTASASRVHAEIAGNEAGEWVLTPGPGKSVKVDGDPVSEPIVLEVGMNLIMGGDHLRCVTEGPARDDMAARTITDALEEGGLRSGPLGIAWSWWLIGGIALVGAALMGCAWFTG